MQICLQQPGQAGLALPPSMGKQALGAIHRPRTTTLASSLGKETTALSRIAGTAALAKPARSIESNKPHKDITGKLQQEAAAKVAEQQRVAYPQNKPTTANKGSYPRAPRKS